MRSFLQGPDGARGVAALSKLNDRYVMSDTSSALWYVAPDHAEVRDTPLTVMDAASVEITAEASLISRGTERLVFSGRVPQGEIDRMRCPMQEGAFPFPVKYGYALAGHVSDGPQDLVEKKVFSLAPHQARIRVPISMARPLPEGLTPARAARPSPRIWRPRSTPAGMRPWRRG
ncbi:MAG: hypothetical protein AAFZ09_11070 [Pseudomonadota bacterium]